MASMEIFETGELFERVQMERVFADGKTFPDCLPKNDVGLILRAYNAQKNKAGFDLKAFVHENFQEPAAVASGYISDVAKPVQEHISQLWPVLTRKPRKEKSSLIPLPKSYIVPGGRFREIYYWDSYFTMLGLQLSKRTDMIENMVNNFAYLIDKIGYIPNGNRSYYKGRSQPPFFSLMVKLLAEEKADDVLIKYQPQLEKEYQFWMQGSERLNADNNAIHRVVLMTDGSILNRYWDENATPRPESYREDRELAHEAADKEIMYRHIRAAAESGWDFSSRWFKDANAFSTIHTTDIVPIDLNCLLLFLEQTLCEIYKLTGNKAIADSYAKAAKLRSSAIKEYCWNQDKKFFFDYDFKERKQKEHFTLAAVFPLYFRLATQGQAENVASIIHSQFFKEGGLITTLSTTPQQWDAPNGWAPLQWMAVAGLMNYGMFHLASAITSRWIALNKKVYKATGKMMEKYNVADTSMLAGGGEYPSQDGFGWTNGVLLKMMSIYY